jgi:predicted metal-dependent HD superfamily phosphohydrolase
VDGPTGEDAFVALAVSCGIDGDDAVELHAGLVRRHAEPHRRYHVLAHVGAVLTHLDTTADTLVDQRAVRLAAWYHDAVYDPTAAGNEAASAALAATELTPVGCQPGLVADVERLVLTTAGHRPVADDERALCDADLAVLGASPEAYERYRSAVRAEYGFLDDAGWRAGRADVLRSLLAAPLFHTAAFAGREQAARVNLTTELATLTG